MVFESLLHQVEIKSRDFQFFGEWNLIRARSLQRQAQQITELRNHGVGDANVFIHHRRNRIQCVKEEVRLQLQAQIFQLRLRELGLKFGSGELLRLGDPQSLEKIEDRHEDGVAEQVIRKFHWIAIKHDAVVVRSLAYKRKKKVAAEGHDRRVCRRKCDGPNNMLPGKPQPAFLFE